MDWREFSFLIIGAVIASVFWIVMINVMAMKPVKEFPIGCQQGDVFFESQSGVTYICNASQEWRPRVKAVNTEKGKNG